MEGMWVSEDGERSREAFLQLAVNGHCVYERTVAMVRRTRSNQLNTLA